MAGRHRLKNFVLHLEGGEFKELAGFVRARLKTGGKSPVVHKLEVLPLTYSA
jgi:hypothetical protein